MGIIGKQFGGRSHVQPGARGQFRTPRQIPGIGEELFTQLIIGTSLNGPNCLDSSLELEERVMEVSNFQQARRIMRDGELLEAVYLADSPSNDPRFANGPQKFVLLNINVNTKAYEDLDTSSANVGAHRLSYPIPGPYGKKIRIKKNADKTISIGDADGSENSPILENNLFSVHYIGNGTAATIIINATGITTTLTAPSDGSANLSIPFAEFLTVGEIVDFINSQPGYVAELVGNPGFLSKELDHIESTEAKAIKAAPVSIYADLAMEISWIESTGYAEFTTVNATRKPLQPTIAPVFLAKGGTSTAPAGSAIKNAIDFAKNFKAFYRNLLGGNLSDKLYFKSVAQELISVTGLTETFAGTGADLTQTLPERKTEAQTLGCYWTNYGVEKFFYFGLDGKEKIYPGYMLSVIDNAISASAMPRETPTWKPLATVLRSAEIIEDKDSVIRAGGLCLSKNPSDGSIIITRSITTERKDNIVLNEKSSILAAMYMVKRLREGFNAQFTGEVPPDERARKVQGVTIPDVIGYVERQLEDFVQTGFLIGSAALNQAAFKEDFGIQIDGDTWSFTDLEGNVVLPINFIFYLLTLNPLRGTGING